MNIAIIGTGIAGATLGRLLNQSGHHVAMLDKGRGIGGRMASRYTHTHVHDHGAQFFTARTEAFQHLLQEFPDAVAEWDAKVTTLSPNDKPYKRDWFEPHFIATPRMNSLCKALLKDLPVQLGVRVTGITPAESGHEVLIENEGTQCYDWVISTAPMEQTLALLPDVSTPSWLHKISYTPCFALMGSLSEAPGFDAAVVKDSIIDWIGISSSKPCRQSEPGLVAHANPAWSIEHLEDDPGDVQQAIEEALSAVGVEIPKDSSLHRWRYARVTEEAEYPYWIDGDKRLAACGDWGAGARVEDAFTSARHLAAHLETIL